MSEDYSTIEAIQADLDECPFNHFCGFTVTALDRKAQTLSMTMANRPEFERLANSKQTHGGPIAALIDTAGCYAVMSAVGYGVPTISFSTEYLRPAIDTILTAQATVRRAGRSIGIVDIDVVNEAGKVVALGRGLYSTAVK